MEEPTQIGISIPIHGFLTSLKENGYFDDMVSAYQFAIALSLRKGLEPRSFDDKRKNMYAVVTVDPEREIFTLIKVLYEPTEVPIYTVVERLADAGLRHMQSLEIDGRLDLVEILRDL